MPQYCKKYLLWFITIILFICKSVSGQTTISGILISEDESRLAGISILVFPASNPTDMLSYAITNDIGRFKVTYNNAADSVIIAIKSMNFRDTIINLPNKTQELNIMLSPDVFELKEVIVKAYPISTRGDTISYIVNSFSQASDRSIKDVIGRMPGFEVTELGQIYYQGKPIQKYYIEGLDLLEKRYPLANNNLPHKSVSSVEVLQNHQPIKMLENKIASDETSINIKLKNDVALTGTLFAGAGYSPFLHEINLTPMMFNKKQQLIVTWQNNNLGDDLNTQHQPVEFNKELLLGNKNWKPNLLGLLQLSKPNIEKQRYLDNNADLISYNHLLKIKKGTELKINSSFYRDKINETGQMETAYFLVNDTVVFSEIIKNRYYNKSFITDMTINQNEKDRYLTNKFSVKKFWDQEVGLIINETNIAQKANTPHFSLSNDFDILFPLKHNFVHFCSFTDYNNSPQYIIFTPGVFKNTLNAGEPYRQTTQNFTKKSISTHNFFQFTLGRKYWIYETEIGVQIEHQQIVTDIEKDNMPIMADSLENNLTWNYTGLYLTENIKYEKDKIRLSVALPLTGLYLNIRDEFYNTPENINKWLFTPSVNCTYKLNGYWTGRLGIRYNQQMGEVSSLAQGFAFSNFRHLKRGIDQLSKKKNFRYNLWVEYKNPISGFFSHFTWMKSHSTNNLLLKQIVNENGLLFYDAVKKDNRSQLDILSFAVNQYLVNWQATVDFKAYYNRDKKEYLLNGQSGWLTNRAYTLHPAISVNRWKNIHFQYSYQIQIIKLKSQQAITSLVENKHNGSIFATQGKRHLIGLSVECYNTSRYNLGYSNIFFANFSYHLKPIKGKFKYKFEIRNIFNQSEMVQFNYSDISLVKNSYLIRPRQFLATVSIGL